MVFAVGIPRLQAGEDVNLRTIEMPKKTEFGAELVTCFLFDSPHAATIACQDVGEPVF